MFFQACVLNPPELQSNKKKKKQKAQIREP